MKYVRPDNENEQKEILMENIMFLTNGDFRKQCPTAYKNISGNLEYLVKLHSTALKNINQTFMSDEEGKIAFVINMKQYYVEFKSFKNNININNQLKLHNMFEVNNFRNILTFIIPSYCQSQIELIEQQGILYNEKD